MGSPRSGAVGRRSQAEPSRSTCASASPPGAATCRTGRLNQPRDPTTCWASLLYPAGSLTPLPSARKCIVVQSPLERLKCAPGWPQTSVPPSEHRGRVATTVSAERESTLHAPFDFSDHGCESGRTPSGLPSSESTPVDHGRRKQLVVTTILIVAPLWGSWRPRWDLSTLE